MCITNAFGRFAPPNIDVCVCVCLYTDSIGHWQKHQYSHSYYSSVSPKSNTSLKTQIGFITHNLNEFAKISFRKIYYEFK